MRALHRTTLAAAAVAGLAPLAFAAPAMAVNPPGNNGTIKIDDRPFDDAPDNEPHVDCRFQLDFYGYDEGPYNAAVTFSVQPPTGKFIPILSDTVFIGEDPAGGGTDLDASVEYRLQSVLNDYEPHPQQGYHVKVEVDAPFSKGADNKFKVFWVEPCASSGGGGSGGGSGS
jgi:hypothetical protein